MDAGKKELERLSVPPHSFTISSFPLPLFSLITLEPDEKAILTSVEVKFDNPTDVTLGFTNALTSPLSIADLLKDAASTSRKVSANWSELIDYSANKDEIYDLLINPLDATLRAAKSNMAGQDFLISESGILGRKKEGEAFADEQMILQNNCLLFTNDGWQTLKTALGKVVVGEENGNPVTAYGLVADVIVGNLLVGQNLAIKNSNSTVLIDGKGIEIKNGNDTVFKADTNGNALLKGEIKATSGNIGGFLIEDTVLKNKDNTLGLSGSGNYLIWAGAEKIDGTGENITPKYETAKFSVTSGGKVKAIDGEFKGKVTATSGTFTGTVFANSGEFNGTIKAGDGHIGGLLIGDGLRGMDENMETFSLTKDGLKITSNLAKIKVGNFETYYNREDGNTYWRTTGALKIQGTIVENGVVKPITSIDLMTEKTTVTESVTVTLYMTHVGDTIKNSRYYIYLNSSTGVIENKRYTLYYRTMSGISWGATKSVTLAIGERFEISSLGTYIKFQISTKSNFSGAKEYYVDELFVKDMNLSDIDTFSQSRSTPDIIITGNLIPKQDGQPYTVGQPNRPWHMVYTSTGRCDQSDRNKKNTIEHLPFEYDKMFDLLVPVRYKLNENTSNRFHVGFIAQDVKKALINVGLTTKDFGGYCEWDENGNTSCGLRYSEFIAINTYQIQQLKKRVEALEQKV